MSTLLTYIAQSHHIRPLRSVCFPDAFVNFVRTQQGVCMPYKCVDCPLLTGQRACLAVLLSPHSFSDVKCQRLRLLNIAEHMQRYVL